MTVPRWADDCRRPAATVGSVPQSGKRKDSAAARQTSARLLEAIQPLANALRPPAPPLATPDAVCAPESLELGPYLRILRWFLEDGEVLRVVAFPDQPDASDPLSSILSGARGKLAAVRDKAPAKTLVAVTDRRIITAKTNAFLEHGEILQARPVERVRYVRAATDPGRNSRSVIDLITRDENIRWHFPADIDNSQVDTLAAVLAETMNIPKVERDALRRSKTQPVPLRRLSRSASPVIDDGGAWTKLTRRRRGCHLRRPR